MRDAIKEAGPDLASHMTLADCGQWNQGNFFQFASGALVRRCVEEGASTKGALHLASRNGGPDQIAALLDAGADVKARDSAGQTTLHAAVGELNAAALMFSPLFAGNTPVAEWHRLRVSGNIAALLDAGADLEARDGAGRTALHEAAMSATSTNAGLEVLGLEDAGEGALREARALAGTMWRQGRMSRCGTRLAGPPSLGRTSWHASDHCCVA